MTPSARRIGEEALVTAATHLVGRTRAYLLEIEDALGEIGSLHDERADRVLEALRMTLREPPRPGTLRHLEMAASELLRALR